MRVVPGSVHEPNHGLAMLILHNIRINQKYSLFFKVQNSPFWVLKFHALFRINFASISFRTNLERHHIVDGEQNASNSLIRKINTN